MKLGLFLQSFYLKSCKALIKALDSRSIYCLDHTIIRSSFKAINEGLDQKLKK